MRLQSWSYIRPKDTESKAADWLCHNIIVQSPKFPKVSVQISGVPSEAKSVHEAELDQIGSTGTPFE